MYAIIEDGSRQYRVSQGDRIRLDHRDVQVGDRIELTRVLLYADGTDTRIGQPAIEGVRVVAEVIGQPTVKTVIQKFRRRKNYRRLKGHTQPFVEVRVKHILLPGQDAPVEEPKPAPEESAPEAAAPAPEPPSEPRPEEPAPTTPEENQPSST